MASIRKTISASGRRKHGYALVACARNETDYIVEWLDYHRLIGFEHVYLYCNDDIPDRLRETVGCYCDGPSPFVTFRHWRHAADEDFVGEQRRMYTHFLRHHMEEVERFCFLDVDEFFVLRGSNNIGCFVDSLGFEADFLYFNWLVYGNSGRIVRDDASVLLSYVHRSPQIDHFTKLICRASAIDPTIVSELEIDTGPFFWHGFDGCGIEGVSFRNVLGESMEGYSLQVASAMLEPATATAAILAKGYIAHFAFKSEQDFAMRAGRRMTNNGMWAYMVMSGKYRERLAELNAVFDDTLSRFWFGHLVKERPARSNIAEGKPSWQSSVAEFDEGWPAGSHMVGRANNGRITGGVGFVTCWETNPWWTVDLLTRRRLASMRLFNRCDDPEATREAIGLEIWVSDELSSWTRVFEHGTGLPFGGHDGEPLVVALDNVAARFVRIRLPGERRRLHLDEVEIYADRPPAPGQARGWHSRIRALFSRRRGATPPSRS